MSDDQHRRAVEVDGGPDATDTAAAAPRKRGPMFTVTPLKNSQPNREEGVFAQLVIDGLPHLFFVRCTTLRERASRMDEADRRRAADNFAAVVERELATIGLKTRIASEARLCKEREVEELRAKAARLEKEIADGEV